MLVKIEQAIDILNHDGVVGMPTETVYGLAARANSAQGIQSIYTLKGRPAENPLIVHVATKETFFGMLPGIPPHTEQLIHTYWPGPLTVVVPVYEEAILPQVRANLPTCAFRAPAHPTAVELIRHVGPLVAPSANRSGRPSSTLCSHIEEDFGASFPVVEGQPPHQGVESTIIIFHEDRWFLGRLGAIPADAIETVLGYPLIERKSNRTLCPGQHFRHYAPKTRLFLTPTPSQPIIVGFSDRCYPSTSRLFSLGHSQQPTEVARNLYDVLRQLDAEGIAMADVDVDIPHTGLWRTILERLNRAAS